jgi:hypothetical protein
MSLAARTVHTSTAARAELVAALDAVDGLTGYAVVPDTATAGAAWPKWVQSTYAGKLCELRVDVWEIYAVLPANYLEETADQGDQLRDVLAPVLLDLGRVEYVEPVAIGFSDNQYMPGLRVRLTT